MSCADVEVSCTCIGACKECKLADNWADRLSCVVVFLA